MIRKWSRIEESCGPEALQHKNQNKVWTAEEKYELVAKVMAGASCKGTAYAAGIDSGLLYQWVQRYKIEGYEGLVAKRKGRPPKEAPMKKKAAPAELTPSEREEMVRLRARVEYLEAENAVERRKMGRATQGEKATLVKELREEGYALKYLLEALGLSRSTYYYEISKKDKVQERNSELSAEISSIFAENLPKYSYLSL